MHVLDAIRSRRTVKAYDSAPVPREQLERILEAARWAPNHRMTEPWRFRVVGPEALERLKAASGGGAKKLLRAPTLVVASYIPSPLPSHAVEDEHAAVAAIYATLLAARAEGVASYWRTVTTFETPEGRAAVGLPEGERVLGLLHFGECRGDEPEAPARRELEHYVTFTD